MTDRISENPIQSLQWYEGINRIHDSLFTTEKLNDRLSLICDGIVDVFGADFCRVWITRPGDRCDSGCIHASPPDKQHSCRYKNLCLHLVASSGRYSSCNGAHARVPYNCYKIGRIASGKDDTFLTNDVVHDPNVHDHDWAEELGLVSFAGYQLRNNEGEVNGVLAFFADHEISAEQHAIMEHVANATSQVIQVSLYTEELEETIQSRTEELVLTNDGLQREIAEHKETAKALETSELRFRSLVNELPNIAVQGYNCEREVSFWNDASARLYGYTAEETAGRKLEDLIVPESLQGEMIDGIRNWCENDIALPSAELTRCHKDGSSVSVYSSHVVQVTGQNEKTMYCVDIDLAELAQAKAREQSMARKLQQAKRMEAIGLMAGGVAHDLNNILSGITGYPELLLLQLPGESNLRKPLEAIKDSGERAAAVVADLLTVARGVASNRTVTSLNSLVRLFYDSPECQRLCSLYPQVECDLQLTDNLPNISCSAAHINKCITNLVINAAEAIKDSGTITLTTFSKVVDEPWAGENGLDPAEYVVVTVADTGTGISKENVEHVFEPFYTKKIMGRSGTGLGLTVVWNTLQEHDGTVIVRSDSKGSIFELFFPVTGDVAEKEPDREKIPLGNGETVLIVDDDSTLRDIASQMLQALGYDAFSVSSGERAIEFVKEKPVDLIVLDMLMEPGINGHQTYEAILDLYPGQRAIIASGFSESDNVKRTLQQGASGFIKKPYAMDGLGRAVKEALNS